MVHKVVLGKRPAFLRRDVEFPLPEGELGGIRIDYKYFTRREFADYVDGLIAQASADLEQAVAAAAEPAPKPAKPRRGAKASQAEAVASSVQVPVRTERKSIDDLLASSSKQLLDIIVGWNLDVPLSLAALDQLCDEFANAPAAISSTLRKAVNEGHSGN